MTQKDRRTGPTRCVRLQTSVVHWVTLGVVGLALEPKICPAERLSTQSQARKIPRGHLRDPGLELLAHHRRRSGHLELRDKPR